MEEEKEIIENNQPRISKKKGIFKKAWFWIIFAIVIIATTILTTLLIINKPKKENKEVIIDISKVKLKISKDYSYFNNEVDEVAAVLINRLEENDIGVNGRISCVDYYKELYDTPYCYRIILDNYDTIFLVENKKNKFNQIFYFTELDDMNFSDSVISTLTKLYADNVDEEELFENINNVFLNEKIIDKDKGKSYIYSHIKFDWLKKDNTYKIIITPTTYESQDKYEESDEFSNSITEEAYNEVKNKLFIGSSQSITEYKYNNEKKLTDVKVKYSKNDLTKYTCATDAQTIAKKLIRSNYVNSIQFECNDDKNSFYYIKYNNLNTISEEELDANTEYYNTDFIQENVNMDILKSQVVSDYKNSCAAVDYKDALRNPGNYRGQKAYWFGEILQVVDKTSTYSTFRVGVSCTKYQYIDGYSCPDAIYVTYYGSDSFIEDDMVHMYGTMEGTQTYTTVMGASVTIPKFYAKYIDLQ